jgi:hypothetical protein
MIYRLDTCNPDREESAGKPTNNKAQLPNGKAMTREKIIRMAWKANLPSCHITHPKALERFAALVAAHEREECVKVCLEQIEAYTSSQYTTDPLGGYRERFGAGGCAAAIRARGEK